MGCIAITSQEKYSKVDHKQYLWLQKSLYTDVHGMVA